MDDDRHVFIGRQPPQFAQIHIVCQDDERYTRFPATSGTEKIEYEDDGLSPRFVCASVDSLLDLVLTSQVEQKTPTNQTNRLVGNASSRLTIEEICAIQVSHEKLDLALTRITLERVPVSAPPLSVVFSENAMDRPKLGKPKFRVHRRTPVSFRSEIHIG